jgi:hypothetical protein
MLLCMSCCMSSAPHMWEFLWSAHPWRELRYAHVHLYKVMPTLPTSTSTVIYSHWTMLFLPKLDHETFTFCQLLGHELCIFCLHLPSLSIFHVITGYLYFLFWNVHSCCLSIFYWIFFEDVYILWILLLDFLMLNIFSLGMIFLFFVFKVLLKNMCFSF